MQLKAMKTIQFCTLAALLLFSVGCSKLTTENYDNIEVGMTYDEVVALLGKADNCSGSMGMKSCTWGNDSRNIKVKFAGENVVIFSSKGL